MPCFRWINTVPSKLKTATGGTCHAFDADTYDFLYLAEAQYRFNRRFDLSTMLTRRLYAAVATGNRSVGVA
ncbi:Transposase [Janthinobacterium sp. CG23_2]|nr:Transposase [Janthinobacterium sp. CG23_2]CUU27636.1 Transposase [Janthinobacterium sp. CG23_2]